MSQKNFLGSNTESLFAQAKENGRAKDTFFKSGTRIRRSIKQEGIGPVLHEQIDFASAGREGVLADKHEQISV